MHIKVGEAVGGNDCKGGKGKRGVASGDKRASSEIKSGVASPGWHHLPLRWSTRQDIRPWHSMMLTRASAVNWKSWAGKKKQKKQNQWINVWHWKGKWRLKKKCWSICTSSNVNVLLKIVVLSLWQIDSFIIRHSAFCLCVRHVHRTFAAHPSSLALSSTAVGPSGRQRSDEINDPCAFLDVTNKQSCLLLLKQKRRSGG